MIYYYQPTDIMMTSDSMKNIKGIIFDYGGTLDSRGVHWSEVIWQGYQASGVDITKENFREAYVHAERELARYRYILPQDVFYTLLEKKIRIELEYLAQNEVLDTDNISTLAIEIAHYCDDAARDCINEARPVLETLSEHFPMMLVSNFYGNIDSVLREYDIRQFFKGIIESAVVGVRKPSPTLFRLGVDALELPASEVLVVGDSLKKDILPAEQLGCKTLWLKGKGWTEDEDSIIRPGMISSITQVLDNFDLAEKSAEI